MLRLRAFALLFVFLLLLAGKVLTTGFQAPAGIHSFAAHHSLVSDPGGHADSDADLVKIAKTRRRLRQEYLPSLKVPLQQSVCLAPPQASSYVPVIALVPAASQPEPASPPPRIS